MDSRNESSCNAPPPLFPAYSLAQNEKEKEKKDWLCNSSFTESTFKEACSQVLKLQDNIQDNKEVSVVCLPAPVKKKRKLSKKEFKKCPDPSSFSVPENESILSQLKKKTFIEETGLSFERAFICDVTRDPENLMFDHFERTKIANYHTKVNIPFGLSLKESFYWSLSFPQKKKKEKEYVRYFNKSFLKSLKNIVSEEFFTNKETLLSTNLEYIPISNVSGIQFSKQTTVQPNFIDVSLSWKSEKNETEAPVKDVSLLDTLLDKEIRKKVVFYNKKLSENPNDVQLWLKFVDFQDELIVDPEKNAKVSLLNSENNVVEKKISILEKALKYNSKNVDLNIAKLKLNRNILNKDELISMWDNLVFINPNNPQVWQEYLLFVISDISNFSIPTVLKLYSKCLRTLSDLNEGIIESHEPPPDIIPNMIGIFSQLCDILNSSGYTEKAIAAYQALIEFNLFCKPSIENCTINEKISCFEPFWDSGAQRIGEKNAIGWATTMQEKKIVFDHISTDSDLNHMEDEILCKKLSVSETWLEFERLRENHHWLPWKPNPDYDQTCDDVDDIERTVSFDDLSKFLFCINDEEQKFLLIINFITFLGFDVHLLGCHNMGNRTICNPISIEDYQNISNQLKSSQLLHHAMNPLCFDKNSCNQDRFIFVNNVFSQTCNKFSAKYKTLLTCLWLKCRTYYVSENQKNKSDITDLKKFAKAILKNNENRNSLLLWFEYICIEWMTDKLSAIKTFQTLLLSSTSAVSSGSMAVQELWYFVQSFFDFYLKYSESTSDKILSANEIIWILIHTVTKEKYIPYSNQEIKPTIILKGVTGFKNYLEKEINSLSVTENLCYCIHPYAYSVISCIKCYAYFQYFCQSCDTALQVYENSTSFISSKITEHLGRYILEQLCIAEAELMNYHIWNSTSSIKPLQKFLCDSVKRYPNNSKLLYMLVKLRNASLVISPTRRFFAQILKNNKSLLITWIFAFAAEFAVCYSLLLQSDLEKSTECLKNIISSMGINWRIRSLYENMLKSNFCIHIPILWRSYLKFEILSQNIENGKSIFHRALQHCGWSKELLIDGIKYFPEEMQHILAFMTEKNIRVHTPLEEVTLLMEHAITDT